MPCPATHTHIPASPSLGHAAGNIREDGLTSDNDRVECMVWNALNTVAANYTPPCGGTVAVILLPCDSNGNTGAQITIAQVTIGSIPVTCDCGVSGVAVGWWRRWCTVQATAGADSARLAPWTPALPQSGLQDAR